mmetsp:Transcript_60766/g.195778  ORF Transcript_60766/g.195778 Transcript_60766/m.195778 type:complete len:295 (-) Transcript_60766:1139-2023(-)
MGPRTWSLPRMCAMRPLGMHSIWKMGSRRVTPSSGISSCPRARVPPCVPTSMAANTSRMGRLAFGSPIRTTVLLTTTSSAWAPAIGSLSLAPPMGSMDGRRSRCNASWPPIQRTRTVAATKSMELAASWGQAGSISTVRTAVSALTHGGRTKSRREPRCVSSRATWSAAQSRPSSPTTASSARKTPLCPGLPAAISPVLVLGARHAPRRTLLPKEVSVGLRCSSTRCCRFRSAPTSPRSTSSRMWLQHTSTQTARTPGEAFGPREGRFSSKVPSSTTPRMVLPASMTTQDLATK